MKKVLFWGPLIQLVFLVFLVASMGVGCKKNTTVEPAKGSFTLTVSLGEGIDGSPATGTYTYNEGDTVTYNYGLKSGYRNLAVTRAWARVPSEGSFTIHSDTRLTASHSSRLQNMLVVRTASNFVDSGDVDWFFNMIDGHGIYGIAMTVKQDEDENIPSGYAFYNSRVAPVAEGYAGFDALQTVLQAAHARGIKVFAWIPQFHDKGAIDRNPDWQMRALVNGNVVPYSGQNPNGKEYFANPVDPNLREYQLWIIREVAQNYDVDGITVDWIRFDDWHMDMTDYTRQTYMGATGIDPLNIDFSSDNEQRRQWNSWRTDIIANYVKDVKKLLESIKPGLFFAVHTLPPDFLEVGQDAAKFSGPGVVLFPLAYWDDWGFEISWTWRTILAQVSVQTDESLIVPNLDTDWSQDEMTEVVQNIKLYYPRITKIAWFRYNQWRSRYLERINNANNSD